jgi:hypothetical protein
MPLASIGIGQMDSCKCSIGEDVAGVCGIGVLIGRAVRETIEK